MNIVINVGGYHLIGTGHTYRQITMMEENPLNNYYFFVNEKQNLSKQILEENLINYQLFKNYEEFYNKIQKLNVDIVINDFLDTDQMYIKKLKDLNIFVVNFEDRGTGIEYADIVINDMYNIQDNASNIYTGFKYTCLRRDLQLYKSLPSKIKPTNIIISFGGSDPQNFTKQILDLIIKNNIHEHIQITTILGLGYKFDDEIYKYAIHIIS